MTTCVMATQPPMKGGAKRACPGLAP
jgi:hypothetical protein